MYLNVFKCTKYDFINYINICKNFKYLKDL